MRAIFDFTHEIAVTLIADVVLRDCLPMERAVFERRLAFHAEQHAQIFACQSTQVFWRKRCQFGMSFTAHVARESHVADGRAYRLQLHPKRRAMVVRLSRIAEDLRLDALTGLSAPRREALINDLLRVKENLMQMPINPAK